MANAKRVYTHVSERAARGIERLSNGRAKVYVTGSQGFTVVTGGRKSFSSRKVIERRERDRVPA